MINRGAERPEADPPVMSKSEQRAARFKPPQKTVTSYKLFRMKDGRLYPLFIDKNESTPVGEWAVAKFTPTKGHAADRTPLHQFEARNVFARQCLLERIGFHVGDPRLDGGKLREDLRDPVEIEERQVGVAEHFLGVLQVLARARLAGEARGAEAAGILARREDRPVARVRGLRDRLDALGPREQALSRNRPLRNVVEASPLKTALTLTIAKHPSETGERMMIRVLAFALRADQALSFGRGLSTEDDPDLVRTDLTGAIDSWIDVGWPDERRVRRACSRARA